MRTITTHHTNECNKAITLYADERNENGVTKQYCAVIDSRDMVNVPPQVVAIPFQYGPIKEAGVNGVTLELLFTIAIDQLEGYQSSKFANEYNETTLIFARGALAALEERTKKRTERGVEGTHEL